MNAAQVALLAKTSPHYIARRNAHIIQGGASSALADRYIIEDVVDDKIGSYEDHEGLVAEALEAFRG